MRPNRAARLPCPSPNVSESIKPIDYAAEPTVTRCPQCSHTVRRLRRSDADRARPDGVRTHRFQCRGDGCGWEGLLPVTRLRTRIRHRQRQRLRQAVKPVAKVLGLTLLLRGLAVAALAVGVPAVVVVTASLGLRLDRQATQRLPEGASHDGRALALQHPLRQPAGGDLLLASAEVETPLTLRQGCAWGQPGRNPYRGSTEQALRQARLPAEVVKDIVARRARKDVTDRLEITTASIRAVKDKREFNPKSFAMTFGHTLCLNARVNFVAGHVEKADLYESLDKQGRRYAVMVPDVCGNVSVLGERGERAPLVNASAAALAPLPWLQAGTGEQDDGFGLSHALAVLTNTNEVPEPATLGLVLAALAGLLAIGRRRP